MLCATLPLYHKANEEALPVYYTVIKHFGHLRPLEKCRQHWPGARVLYVSFMFSNACRLLYLLHVNTFATENTVNQNTGKLLYTVLYSITPNLPIVRSTYIPLFVLATISYGMVYKLAAKI